MTSCFFLISGEDYIKKVLEKLKRYSIISLVLGFLTIVSGATTLGFASKNIGFPVFNFGPLLVGIIVN